jgi:TolA-binding protein
VIEAGVLGVEVVGTRFTVERGPQGVQVRVREGAVLVRSPGLRDGVQRLTAGEELALANTATQPQLSAAPPQSVPPVPSSSPPAGVDELLQRADQARLSGDLGRARSALETVLARHADDPRAALAAYQLALVREQQGERGSAVVAAFASACERAVGGSLRQDCYFRLSRAQARAGQRREARSTAERSLREFPQGRHAERLRRFVSGQADGP